MKKILIILLVFPLLLSASPVSPNLAQQVAQNFINTITDSISNAQFVNTRKLKPVAIKSAHEENRQYYIFNSEEGEGFVIVAANDVAIPILGYSTENSIDPTNLPIQLEELLQAYTEEIQYAVENNLYATDSIKDLWNSYKRASQTNQAASTMSALISTKWDQSPYYNIKCPSDASLSSLGGHPTTGCVATAMAQIMKYWEYPEIGIGNKSYNSQYYGTLSANFAATTYDWDNMPIKLSSSTTMVQNNAVATLMYHCGVAVSMNYNCDNNGGSGAYVIDYGGGRASAEVALKNYFGYASTIVGKTWTSSTSATTWKNMLKNELDNRRPILYAGRSSSSGGHAFVCDGYDSNDKFHFNWGWGGSANGFFSLTALTPSGGNFTYEQQAVIGIKPKDGSGPAKNYDLYMNTDLNAINTNGSSSTTNPYTFGNTISFTAKVENNGTGIFNGSFKVGAFTSEGEFIAWSKESYHFSLEAGNKTVQKNYTFDGGFPFIPGKYRAYMYYQDDDEDYCKLVKTDEGILLTEYNNVVFNVVSSSDLKPVSEFNVALGSFTSGSRIRIEIDVKNTAFFTTFYGQIRLNLYNLDGTRNRVIDYCDYSDGFSPRATHTLAFYDILDVEPGSYYLALTYKETDQMSWYYMGCDESYPNPIRVNVKAPTLCADDYEINNTQATATTLIWDIDPEITDYGTLQVSLHENSDIDYYKLLFPNAYRYKVNINLYDKYNQGGWYYENADAQFAYSIGGTTYSNYYKNNNTISFDGPTTLYIKVAQFGECGLGYYELSGDIEENINNAIDDIESDEIGTTSKIIRNGQIYILSGNGVYTVTGKKVK